MNYRNEGHIINATLIRLIKYKHCVSAAVSSQSKDMAGILYFLDRLTGKFATKKVLRAKYVSSHFENLFIRTSSLTLEHA